MTKPENPEEDLRIGDDLDEDPVPEKVPDTLPAPREPNPRNRGQVRPVRPKGCRVCGKPEKVFVGIPSYRHPNRGFSQEVPEGEQAEDGSACPQEILIESFDNHHDVGEFDESKVQHVLLRYGSSAVRVNHRGVGGSECTWRVEGGKVVISPMPPAGYELEVHLK